MHYGLCATSWSATEPLLQTLMVCAEMTAVADSGEHSGQARQSDVCREVILLGCCAGS